MSKSLDSWKAILGKIKTFGDGMSAAHKVMVESYGFWTDGIEELLRKMEESIEQKMPDNYKIVSMPMEIKNRAPYGMVKSKGNYGMFIYNHHHPDYPFKLFLVILNEDLFRIILQNVEDGEALARVSKERTIADYETPYKAIDRFVEEVKARAVCASMGVV